MQVSRLTLENFRGSKSAELEFDGHTLLIGGNNVGKSTICEALELALGPDRQRRFPVVEEYDFYNAVYLDENEDPVEIRIEVLLTDVTPTIEKACGNYLERWDPDSRRILGQGEIGQVDGAGFVWCLRLLTVARYDQEEGFGARPGSMGRQPTKCDERHARPSSCTGLEACPEPQGFLGPVQRQPTAAAFISAPPPARRRGRSRRTTTNFCRGPGA